MVCESVESQLTNGAAGVCVLMQKMLDEGVVAHASGDAMRTFVYGFYFYRIVGEKEGEGEGALVLFAGPRSHGECSQAPPRTRPPRWLAAGLRRLWRTSPCSRGSGSRWPSCGRSSVPATCRRSCYRGCRAARRPIAADTARSAAASGDAARPLRCSVGPLLPPPRNPPPPSDSSSCPAAATVPEQKTVTLDVDVNNRSGRTEWCSCYYHGNFSVTAAFEIKLHWMAVTAAVLFEMVSEGVGPEPPGL